MNRDLAFAIKDGMSIGNFGDNLNLSSWQPSLKPLTSKEKKDIIRRIKLGWVSNDFIKSYREFAHLELVKKNNQAQSEFGNQKLSFDKLKKDMDNVEINKGFKAGKWFNNSLESRDKLLKYNTYVKKWKRLSNSRINKKFSKLTLDERKDLLISYDVYMRKIDWQLNTSVARNNIINEDDFKNNNVLYYFLVLKSLLCNFNMISDRILLKNSIKDAIKELCIIAQNDMFIRNEVISSVVFAITKKESEEDPYKSHLFINERIEKSLKEISGVELGIKDPLEGINNNKEVDLNEKVNDNFKAEITNAIDWSDYNKNWQSHVSEELDSEEEEKSPEELAKEKAYEKKILDKIKNDEFRIKLDNRYGENFSFNLMSTMDKLFSLESKLINTKTKLSTYEDSEKSDLKEWNKLKDKVSDLERKVYRQQEKVDGLKCVTCYKNYSEDRIPLGQYILSYDNLVEFYDTLRAKPTDKKEGEIA